MDHMRFEVLARYSAMQPFIENGFIPVITSTNIEYKKPITDPFNVKGAPRIKTLAAHKKILDLAKARGREVWFDVHIWNHNPRDALGPISALRSLAAALENGTSFGTPNPSEIEMAELIVKFFPSIQKVRMCNSGTEATMSAIRLARGFTGREKIIKFDGCYHGHADSLLVKAGSGALTFGNPDSAGVPAARKAFFEMICPAQPARRFSISGSRRIQGLRVWAS